MDKLGKRRSRIVRWFLRAAAGGMLVLFLGWLFVAIQIQLNHIPDSMKQPPAAFAAFERQPASPEAAASRGAAAHPRWNNPDPPESFEDYVRFRLEGDPGDEGAKLYLELAGPYAKEKYYEQWNRLFAPETGPAWQPGVALNDAQRQWLETHGDWIGKLRRMIAAGGPPTPGADERSKDDIVNRLKFPTPDILLLQTAGKILVAESERLREANDQAAAADLLLASYSLAAETINQQMIGQLVSTSVRKWTDQAIAAWFASDPPGGSSLNRLRDGLDASRDGDRGRRSRIAAEELADMRMAGIYQFDQPIVYWAAGWNAFLEAHDTPPPSRTWDYAKFLRDDPLRAIELAYRVERSKARAADELREFDALSVRFLNQLRGPYPAMDFEAWNEACMKMSMDYNPFERVIPDFRAFAVRVVSGEASKNLNRSAIRLLQGEKPTLDLAADPESDAWLDSPWRDPFTEKPLHIQDDGDATLIYSLGPDQKDQGGAILYDPSNGTISDGDLAIRIPRR